MSMVPAAAVKRSRYGTRQFIVKALESPDAKNGLRTSELASKVRELAGKPIPGPTIFQAARSLVRARKLLAKRDGREFRFTPASSGGGDSTRVLEARPSPAETATNSLPGSADSVEAPTSSLGLSAELVLAGQNVVPSTLPHRLEPGQVLVLRHDEKAIVTVSNVHGKVVVEKHDIP